MRVRGESAGFIVAVVAFGVVAVAAYSRHGDGPAAESIAVYRQGLRTLDSSLVLLDSALRRADTLVMRSSFRNTRRAYKRVELFVEYYGRFARRDLNGAPLPYGDDEDPENPLPPIGLQVIEAALFPSPSSNKFDEARRQVPLIRVAVGRLALAGADTMPGDEFLFDALRLAIDRVGTLGVAGFDATASGDAITESAEVVEAVSRAFGPYHSLALRKSPAATATLDDRFTAATGYLRAHPGFDAFDRLTFLRDYLRPLSSSLAEVQRALGVGPPPRPRALTATTAGVYDRDAFNAMFFAADEAPAPTSGLIALGKDLFFDVTLSASRKRSCATCHVPELGFADGRARAFLIEGHAARGGGRNTPSLFNAGLQPGLFADQRVRTLEDQATDVIGSATEMGGSLDRAAEDLRRVGEYSARFARVFNQPAASSVTSQSVRLALAAYVRSLIAMNSRFDQAVRGDTAAMTIEEVNGFNVFMGKAACGTCHFAPLFNGASPPLYLESEPEVIGVPSRNVSNKAVIDPDSGRFILRHNPPHLFAFKTPTLRNIALTAPYMHNGVFTTLEQVVDFYDGGGGHGRGVRVTQTLPTDSLRLSALEKRSLVAFMRALTDTVRR